MAQMVKSLSCRHEHLNLVSTAHVLKKTNSRKGPCACDPSGAEAEAGRMLRSVCQSTQMGESYASEILVSQNQGGGS